MINTRLMLKTSWLGLWAGLALLTSLAAGAEIRVEIFEGISSKKSWSLGSPRLVEDYPAGAFGLMDVRQKYSDKGLRADRSNPFLVRMTAKVKLPAGEQRLLLRSRNAARQSGSWPREPDDGPDARSAEGSRDAAVLRPAR